LNRAENKGEVTSAQPPSSEPGIDSQASSHSSDNHEHRSHGELLNNIYSLQRHFYDVTRKYYLFGRDHILKEIIASRPESLLEIGCGTGRNLFILERMVQASVQAGHTTQAPELFGLDASTEMLAYAKKHQPTKSQIHFAYGYAESFGPSELFSRGTFSDILFSYSLSMIPESILALNHALTLIPKGGRVWIVDFWDQSGYPIWFQKLLQWWLRLFHVEFSPELFSHIKALPDQWSSIDTLRKHGAYSVSLRPVGRKYGYLACITRDATN